MGKPGIVSVGNRREWPPELWGSRDWEDEARTQQPLGRVPVAQPRYLFQGFGSAAAERERAQEERRRVAADVALVRAGVGVGQRQRSLPPPRVVRRALGHVIGAR